MSQRPGGTRSSHRKRPLSGTQVGPATGHVTAFLNGRRFAGDPRSIKLTPQAVIQLDVGKVVPCRASRSQLVSDQPGP